MVVERRGWGVMKEEREILVSMKMWTALIRLIGLQQWGYWIDEEEE
jgi:hypothetical protein